MSSVPMVTSDPMTSSSMRGQQAQPIPVTPALSKLESVTSGDLLTSSRAHSRNLSSTSFGSVKGAVYSDEWQDDEISEMAAQSGIEAPLPDTHKKRIVPDSSFAEGIAADDDEDMNELTDEDEDKEEEDSEAGDLEWENDTPIKPQSRPSIDPIITGQASALASQRWKRVSISGAPFDIDLLAVEPYKSVLSHGGYYDEGLSAIICFYGCHLPSRRQEDYTYLMNHLFHYVIHTLEELVADDYVIIYFHGSTPRRQMPGLGWLKRCYQSIDRRLKKNLKGLYLVHPTLWLRTVVTMIKPFISSKFSSKLRFVRTLEELNSVVPMENINIPEAIVQVEEFIKENPQYLEEQEEEERRQMKEEKKEEKRKKKEQKKEEKERKKQEKKAEKERKKAMKKEKEKEKAAGKG